MERTSIVVLAVLSALAANAAVKALDFEGGEECRHLPAYNLPQQQTGVTNVFASSGKQSFFFRMRAWKKGENEWPLFILKPPVPALRRQGRDSQDADRLVAGPIA